MRRVVLASTLSVALAIGCVAGLMLAHAFVPFLYPLFEIMIAVVLFWPQMLAEVTVPDAVVGTWESFANEYGIYFALAALVLNAVAAYFLLGLRAQRGAHAL